MSTKAGGGPRRRTRSALARSRADLRDSQLALIASVLKELRVSALNPGRFAAVLSVTHRPS
jgi:hypothetical protein